MPRVQLFERIDARCEVIVEAGLLQVSYRNFTSALWNGGLAELISFLNVSMALFCRK